MAIALVPAPNSGSTGIARNKGNAGPLRIRVFDATFSGSYATGGESIAASSVGLRGIVGVIGQVTEGASATATLVTVWNASTGKLQVYGMAAAAGVGTALAEKNAAAYNASTAGRLIFIGY